MTCITSADALSPRQARRTPISKSSRGLTMIFRFTTMGVAKRLHLHDFGQGRRLGQIHRLLDVGQSDSQDTAVAALEQDSFGHALTPREYWRPPCEEGWNSFA